MKNKLMLLLLLAVDIAMVVMEWRVYSAEWRSSGPRMLRYYTNSSNVLAMLVCAVCAVCELACLMKGCALPGWTQVLRYVASCCLMVTLIVAACILVPMTPGESLYGFMIRGSYLYIHTLCPLIMLAACLLHGGTALTAKHALIAVAPTVVYGIITLIMNARRVYLGPYFFCRIDLQPWYMTCVWFTVIIGGNFIVSWLIGKLQNLIR